MRYCKNCGQELFFETLICPNCKEEITEVIKEVSDSSTTYGFWAIVIGVIPILGWIIGGIGYKKAKEFNNKRGKILNIIGIIIASVSFLINFYLVSEGYY